MRILAAAALVAGLGLSACGDPNFLSPATIENAETGVRLWAIQGTPVHLPSAWSIALRNRVRLDQGPNFDFAFDITDEGTPVLLPLGAFGLLQRTGNPGLFKTGREWGEITLAEVNGYVVADTIPIAVGDRLFARSALSAACANTFPLYAKLEIQAIDHTERSVSFRILTNSNCGYKGLEPGLPSR